MRPIYIICSESGTEDKATHLVSIFNVLEKITITRQPPGEDRVIIPTFRFCVMAVWMKEPGEDDRQFEGQMLIDMPGRGIKEFDIKSFSIPAGKFLQRFRITHDGPTSFGGSGLLRFISRVREVGSTDWITQEYPVIIEDQSEQPMLLELASTHGQPHQGSEA